MILNNLRTGRDALDFITESDSFIFARGEIDVKNDCNDCPLPTEVEVEFRRTAAGLVLTLAFGGLGQI